MKNHLPIFLIIFGIVNALAISVPYFVLVPRIGVLYEDLEQVPDLSLVRILVAVFWVFSFAQLIYGLFLRRKLKAEKTLRNPYLAIGILLLVIPTGLLFAYGLPSFLVPIYSLTSSF